MRCATSFNQECVCSAREFAVPGGWTFFVAHQVGGIDPEKTVGPQMTVATPEGDRVDTSTDATANRPNTADLPPLLPDFTPSTQYRHRKQGKLVSKQQKERDSKNARVRNRNQCPQCHGH